jgi:hypothetical protein
VADLVGVPFSMGWCVARNVVVPGTSPVMTEKPEKKRRKEDGERRKSGEKEKHHKHKHDKHRHKQDKEKSHKKVK